MFTPPYRELSRFAGNLALGVESDLLLPQALSLALRSLARTHVARHLNDPVEKLRQGVSLADALSSAQKQLPRFILPTIRAGEETGRLEESLRFLEKHCSLLARPALSLVAQGSAGCMLLGGGRKGKIGRLSILVLPIGTVLFLEAEPRGFVLRDEINVGVGVD